MHYVRCEILQDFVILNYYQIATFNITHTLMERRKWMMNHGNKTVYTVIYDRYTWWNIKCRFTVDIREELQKYDDIVNDQILFDRVISLSVIGFEGEFIILAHA